MLEQLKYKNHLNEVFEFGKDGIFVNMSDLHNYEWSVTTKNSRISDISRKVGKRKLPIVIICDDEASGTAAKNRLLEVTEKDVIALKHGQIILGDYYFRCFVTKSEKSRYLTNKRFMTLDLTLTTDFSYWVKETTFVFRKLGEQSGKNLDYDFDYPFDYFSGTGNKQLNNTSFANTDFQMIIYGACENPAVYVQGHCYQINCAVGASEYLTIDSAKKTVTKTANNGTVTNVFNGRSRDSYIFQPIPPGNNTVLWEGDFGVDITLFEERSEPKWT